MENKKQVSFTFVSRSERDIIMWRISVTLPNIGIKKCANHLWRSFGWFSITAPSKPSCVYLLLFFLRQSIKQITLSSVFFILYRCEAIKTGNLKAFMSRRSCNWINSQLKRFQFISQCKARLFSSLSVTSEWAACDTAEPLLFPWRLATNRALSWFLCSSTEWKVLIL